MHDRTKKEKVEELAIASQLSALVEVETALGSLHDRVSPHFDTSLALSAVLCHEDVQFPGAEKAVIG